MSASNYRRLDVDRSISDLLPQPMIFRPQRFDISLSVIRSRSSLLKPSCIPNSEQPETMARALHRLVDHRHSWCRPIESWQPASDSRDVQFDSLVRHLFVKYELPAFMPRIWLRDSRLERRLFFHLASGLSIRRFGVRCTKSMVPHFMCGPADLTASQALRWAQARSLGADKKLARAIVQTRLKDRLRGEEFWNQVIVFLVREMVGVTEAVEMIDFLYRQKFMKGSEAYGLLDVNEPLQRNLDVTGRNLDWLRKRMAHWRDEVVAARSLVNGNAWPATDIREFVKPHTDGRWTITEITSLNELHAEAGIMRHCVFLYLGDCRKHLSSIWSLKRCSEKRDARILTIEVHNRSRSIVQIKGKCNRAPTGDELSIVRTWASEAGLTIGC